MSVTCPKCKSENIVIQAVGETRTKKRTVFWWIYFIIFGWVIELFMWLFLTLPMLLIRIFHKKGIETKIREIATCQNCGYQWKVK